MLMFLCFDSINDCMLKMKGKRLSSANYLKCTHNNWFNSQQTTLKPFNSINSILNNVIYPLTSHHHCLIVEDFMLLKPNDKIIMLLNKSNHLLSNTKGSKGFISLLQDVIFSIVRIHLSLGMLWDSHIFGNQIVS